MLSFIDVSEGRDTGNFLFNKGPFAGVVLLAGINRFVGFSAGVVNTVVDTRSHILFPLFQLMDIL